MFADVCLTLLHIRHQSPVPSRPRSARAPVVPARRYRSGGAQCHVARLGAGGSRVASRVDRYVKLVFVIHVGGTRYVTSSTDNIMKIHVRITLTVECIRTCIFLF